MVDQSEIPLKHALCLLLVFTVLVSAFLKNHNKAPIMNSANSIFDILKLIKENIKDDIESTELMINRQKLYAKEMSSRLAVLRKKEMKSPEVYTRVSSSILADEIKETDIVCSFLEKNFLASIKLLSENFHIEAANAEKKLKVYCEADNKLKKQLAAIKEKDKSDLTIQIKLKSIQEQRNALYKDNLHLLERCFHDITHITQNIIRELGQEHHRLLVFKKTIGTGRSLSPSLFTLLFDAWDNINVQSFKNMIEKEVISPENELNKSAIIKEAVKVKEAWGGWKDCNFVLFPNSIVLTKAEKPNQLNSWIVEYKFAISELQELGKLELAISKKKQSILVYFFGLGSVTVKFKTQEARDRIIKNIIPQ
ncbi:hypothetical protein GINT2_002291 [Glugoides intestinalis]